MLVLSPSVHATNATALLDARLAQGVPVEGATDDELAGEVVAQQVEGVWTLVDDRDLEALPDEVAGQARADPAAAGDDHVHRSPLTSVCARLFLLLGLYRQCGADTLIVAASPIAALSDSPSPRSDSLSARGSRVPHRERARERSPPCGRRRVRRCAACARVPRMMTSDRRLRLLDDGLAGGARGDDVRRELHAGTGRR